MSITEPLQAHHHHCDELFAQAEESGGAGDWARCAPVLGEFLTQMARHFETEETVLFPAFEAATGSTAGPTQVMRMEHTQMRDLMARLQALLGVKDADGFAGNAETLLILMQQHNMKEENILYPMCNHALAASLGAAITERMAGA